jgi:endonuclease-3
MKKKEFVQFIIDTLETLYPNPARPLDGKDAYELLIAVLLSARSTDKKVNEVTKNLFILADTPYKMVQLSVDEIRAIIKPCGLSPQKAKNIKALSQILIDKYEGQVPKSIEELEELPGVGHKTASVVAAQAFNIDAFPVDTHIFRLARRFGLSKGKTVEKVEADLKKTFPKSKWIKLHIQIIYFARQYCRAVKHDPMHCPICCKLKINQKKINR